MEGASGTQNPKSPNNPQILNLQLRNRRFVSKQEIFFLGVSGMPLSKFEGIYLVIRRYSVVLVSKSLLSHCCVFF